MIGAQGTDVMFANMLISTAVLIGTVAVLVVLGLVVYYKTARTGRETQNEV